MRMLDIPIRPKHLPQVQALAALGQCKLMALWESLFSHLRQPIAQILLTRNDIADRSQYLNAQNTIAELLGMGIVPIVNENDTLAVTEIKFGDNDTLSAITAAMVQADYLFLMTDVDCLYDKNPRIHADAKPIEVVHDIGALEADVSTSGSSLGTGGMGTKIVAARLATSAGVTTVITRSSLPGNIYSIIEHIHSQNESMFADKDRAPSITSHPNHLSTATTAGARIQQSPQLPQLPQTPGLGPGMATLDYLNSPVQDQTPESSLESLNSMQFPRDRSSDIPTSASRPVTMSSIAPTSTTFYPSGLSSPFRDSTIADRPLTFSMTNGVFKRMFGGTVPLHTRFLPNPKPIRDRYFWLLHGLAPHGTIYIDAGAHKALQDHAGLLPVGVIDVDGMFNQQEAVRIVVVYRHHSPHLTHRSVREHDPDETPRQRSVANSSPPNNKPLLKAAPKGKKGKAAGQKSEGKEGSRDEEEKENVEVGRAIVNYSAVEIARIKGLRSDEIGGILGYSDSEYVALRENVALLETR